MRKEKALARNFWRKTPEAHRAGYRKNWTMVFEDKRYSAKRKQQMKSELRRYSDL